MDSKALCMDKDPTEELRAYYENLINVEKENTSEAKAAVTTWQNSTFPSSRSAQPSWLKFTSLISFSTVNTNFFQAQF